jgi:uncharacterized damage-inducible protein DinB
MDNLNPIARDLADDLERAYDGDPWHGSSLTQLLAGIDARTAEARPIASAHSIWELVLHMAAWTNEVARRLRGAMPATPREGDWPPVPQPATDAEWQAALDSLAAAHHEVLSALRDCPPDRLGARVGNSRDPALGSGLTYAGMVRGLAQHHAYHGGQVVLLRRAVEGATRSPAHR